MTQTEKLQTLIDACIAKMNEADKAVYRPIAEYAAQLGYTPKPIKKAGGNVDELAFLKNKVKRTLMRIHPCIDKAYGQVREVGKAQLRLVFFATSEYSEPFRFGIKNVIEAFDGNYTGYYVCGRCNDDERYIYIYPDGKKVFRCGCQLIELPPMDEEYVDEIKAMMKAQDDFWMQKARAGI